jgi:hypothetical protein
MRHEEIFRAASSHVSSTGFIQDAAEYWHTSLQRRHRPLYIGRTRSALFDHQQKRIDVRNKSEDIGAR